ncbi:MAG: HNH endonuclease [Jatrophihabitantaceae bacterium]
MKACVGVTDQGWYEFLAARPHLTEANFWLPSGGPATFRVIAPGDPLLFKTHYPHNRLVGGGILSDYRRLPMSLAWDAFGEENGAASLVEMRRAIAKYRKAPLQADEDPVIGCVMLRDVAFPPASDVLPAPDDFAKNIVQWKGYTLGAESQSPVERMFRWLVGVSPGALGGVDVVQMPDGPMFGRPRLVAPRLGQDAFVAVVQDAYRMRCAVTGAKIRPALQAAHIRPVARDGQHRVDNGLLLRADVHIMFDRGYLGVDPQTKALHVSARLRTTFGNGEEFYAKAGTRIAVPERRVDRPNREFLEWHMDEVFQP